MAIVKAKNLACPIDGERLYPKERQLVCDNGHTYDIARQGYVNLLPVQYKRSKQPGDTKEMVIARAQLLNSGVYAPIANKAAEIIATLIASRVENTGAEDNRLSCVLDAGCGEGYYIDAIFNDLVNKEFCGDISLIGLDISKAAIAVAAKRNKQISWVVGTNRQPPIAPASVDIILCVFGFHSFEGFSPILKSGAKIILVEPGPDHLKELREIIYPEVKKTDPADLSGIEGYAMVESQSLRFNSGIVDNEHINNLLLMTPHFYRATPQGRLAAANLKQMDLTVDVVFRVLGKIEH